MWETKDLTRCRSFAEVDLSAIRHNALAVKACLEPGVKFVAVVKAEAYGHGSVPVSRALEDVADFLAVATAEEAVKLKEAGLRTPVLLLGHVPESWFADLIRLDVRLAADSEEEMRAIAREAEKAGKAAIVHAAVDTGMTRIGFFPTAENAARLSALSRLPGVCLEGLFSHLATADRVDKRDALAQVERFRQFREMLTDHGVCVPLSHISASAATISMDAHFDMARPGIVLYGLVPSAEVSGKELALRPAMRFAARIVRLTSVPAGTAVSYGGTFVTKRETLIATVAAGYADGVPRALSGKGCVLLDGKRLPILGRVCMDQFMVDATDVPGAALDRFVTIFGCDGEGLISADEVADICGTIGYEIVTGVSQRVPRVYLAAKEA